MFNFTVSTLLFFAGVEKKTVVFITFGLFGTGASFNKLNRRSVFSVRVSFFASHFYNLTVLSLRMHVGRVLASFTNTATLFLCVAVRYAKFKYERLLFHLCFFFLLQVIAKFLCSSLKRARTPSIVSNAEGN